MLQITDYPKFILYLTSDVNICDKNLLLALCVHNKIVLQDTVWSPRYGVYVLFDAAVHGQFLVYHKGSAHHVDSRKLYSAFCITCYLLERETVVHSALRKILDGSVQYPGLCDRSVVLFTDNLTFKPPDIYYQLLLDPDTHQSVKVGLELLWAWLKVLYMGDYHTLIININYHIKRPSNEITHKDLRDRLNQGGCKTRDRLEWYVIKYVTQPKEWFLLHENTRWVFQASVVDW